MNKEPCKHPTADCVFRPPSKPTKKICNACGEAWTWAGEGWTPIKRQGASGGKPLGQL